MFINKYSLYEELYLEELEILEEVTGYKRNRIFVFEEYVKLFR